MGLLDLSESLLKLLHIDIVLACCDDLGLHWRRERSIHMRTHRHTAAAAIDRESGCRIELVQGATDRGRVLRRVYSTCHGVV